MFRFVILLAFVAGAIGAADSSDEVMPGVEGRVAGGTPTVIGSVPYTVSVQVIGSHHCGGVILNPTTILTSARCVIRRAPSTLRVRAGSSYSNQLGVLINVSGVRIHERYNPNTLENDLAALRLNGTLRFGTNINTISLASWTPANGTAALLAGWGTTNPSSPTFSEHLSSAEVSIIGRSECTVYGYEIKGDMICAASHVRGIGASTGDEGGPLVANNILVGIISIGRSPRYPTICTNVATHRNWIINASH